MHCPDAAVLYTHGALLNDGELQNTKETHSCSYAVTDYFIQAEKNEEDFLKDYHIPGNK
jgi:hypothetical protein